MRRDHVRWQSGVQQLQHRGSVQCVHSIAHKDVGRQLLQAIARQELHAGRANLRMLQEDRFDLGKLDPIAADFHLGIDATEKLEISSLAASHQIAGAVQAQRRLLRRTLT